MTPSWVKNGPDRWTRFWNKPWTYGARHSRSFKRACWKHGHVSPNFTRAEWNCHDGTKVPASLKANAQRNGFHLERFRHAVGDVSMPILSGYRTVDYNRRIGGAVGSRHTYADAADFSVSVVNAIGHDRFFKVAEVVFANGGVGQYPGGSAHLDSRGYRSRWTSF